MELEYGTATRIDEVLSLKIRQINLKADKPYITVIGKGSKIRSAYLMSGLVTTLKKTLVHFIGWNQILMTISFTHPGMVKKPNYHKKQ